jgi:hypothetical protein
VGTTPGLEALEKKSLFSLPEIEPRFLGSPAYILVIIPTMLSTFFLSESNGETPQKRQSPSRDLNTQDTEYKAKYYTIKTCCLFSIT